MKDGVLKGFESRFRLEFDVSVDGISLESRISLKCFVDQTDSEFTHTDTIPGPGLQLGRLF